MDYKGYSIKENKNGIVIENVKDFNPVHILECGQCFRWIKQNDGSYTGVAKRKAVNIRYSGGTLEISNSSTQDFIDIWFDYFDLGRDYSKVKELLCKDEVMKKAIDFGWGIRLLRQDIWEMLISFIISANNRIPMIMKTIDKMTRIYGNEIKFDNQAFYDFPDASSLSGLCEEELEVCRAGFRCKYIIQTSRAVSQGVIDLSGLSFMDTDQARKELMKMPGVGPKVADCVLLYSGTKDNVFPTDVWVKRIMEELYFKREVSLKEIQEFAASYFGELAGLAQQYLFYYARENKIGTDK